MSNITIPTIEDAKRLAKQLRDQIKTDGEIVSHSKSLELLAQQQGYRDWNTMHAAIEDQPSSLPVKVGQTIRGHYLGHAFTADVLAVQRQSNGSRYKVTLNLEKAVDVVTFDSFSAFRKRINATVNQDGATTERNSQGVHILKLAL